jgi:hypothetical protein
MIPQKHLSVLHLLCDRLERTNWVLTGSTSFALHGISLIPRDIDLQADADVVFKIEWRLAESVTQVSFYGNKSVRSLFGR